MTNPKRINWQQARVCVTGGTGFLGTQLVKLLVERGAEVRIHALKPSAQALPQGYSRLSIYGDIRDRTSVQEAVRGCQVVFHTAGIVGVSRDVIPLMHEIHEVGTRNVLESVEPGTRVIHTSSLLAVAAAAQGVPVAEETPFNLEGARLPYVHAKRNAERMALKAAEEGKDVVVVNPAYLVGPEDHERSVMGDVCIRFWRGRLPLAPPGGFNLVDVRDAAVGHLLAAERGERGRRYLLGGENHSFHSLLKMLAAVAEMNPRVLPRLGLVGYGLLTLLSEARAKLRGKNACPSWGHFHLNRHFWYCSSERARNELGFEPRPLRESLRDAYLWHRENGSLTVRGLAHWLLRPSMGSTTQMMRELKDHDLTTVP